MSRPQVPAEIKPIQPFLHRADEFRSKDPVVSYWCEYHAVKTGLMLKPQEGESQAYLTRLLVSLEATKKTLRDREAVSDNGVARSYVKNYANKMFKQADQEDRRGATCRSTAKKFLAASQFFETLKSFKGARQIQEPKINEKRVYAKKRAAEISKALRDNRTLPPPGSPDSWTGSSLPGSPNLTDSNDSQTIARSSVSSLPLHEAQRRRQGSSDPTYLADVAQSRLGNEEESKQGLKTKEPTVQKTPSEIQTSTSLTIPMPWQQLSTSALAPSLNVSAFSDIMSPMPTISTLLAEETGLIEPSHIVAWSKAVLDLVCCTQLDEDSPRPPIPHPLVHLASVAVEHITNITSLWAFGDATHVPAHVIEALYLRGMLKASGALPEKIVCDPGAAFSDFEVATKLGYAAGWFKLGQAYESSHHNANARKMFERGAKLKEVNSLYRLGIAYLLGELDLPATPSLAMKLLGEATDLATTECPHPPYVFGVILLCEFPQVTLPPEVMAQTLSKSPLNYPRLPMPEARRYVEHSAYLGFGPALYRMGRVYGYAEMDCEYNPQLSVKYYLAASERGVVEANMGLSKWYLRGFEGVFERDENLAVAFAEKAAQGGSALGMFTMGYYHEMGVGVKMNRTEAIKWYMKAAAQGDTEASGRLAKLKEKLSEPSGLPNLRQQDKLSVKIASSRMSLQEMFDRLLDHGCTDLSSQIDLDAQSHFAISGGAFGDVYCGKLRDGTTVAIKALRHHMLLKETAPKALKRAMREIYIWSKAKHDNVQDLMGVIVFQGCLGMVSLWMDNGTMEEYLQNNPRADRHQLCMYVTHGVSYLHGIGMVHGDLKARNVLVDQNGVPKLSDFDHSILSKYTLAFTETTNTGGGTLRWMAPELLLATEEESATSVVTRTTQADIYALGMTMLEILTGRVPYSEYRVDSGVVLALHQRRLPKRPKELLSQDKMWMLLLTCWGRNPQARPTASSVYLSLSYQRSQAYR